MVSPERAPRGFQLPEVPRVDDASEVHRTRDECVSVEHGRHDPEPYLLALQDVLNAARVRQRSATQDATVPAA